MIRRLLVAAALVVVAGCMEVEQTVNAEQRQAGSTVKRDTAAWDNEPLAIGPKWTKGDRNSWEAQIKTRQLVQNERSRGRN